MKNLKIATFLLFFLVFANLCEARPRTILELYYSCGRVNVPGAAGSGTIISEQQDSYIALTNKHVTSNNATATMDFWPSGNQKTVTGKVVFTKYEQGMSVDLALLEIPKTEFKDWKPTPVPFAPYELQLQTDSYIFSIGSPRAYHSFAWNGRVLDVSSATFTFNPTSIGGQSGSSILANIFNTETKEYDTKIVGLLTWSVPASNSSGSIGAAQKHQVILDAVAGRVAYREKIPDTWKEVPVKITPLERLPSEYKPVSEPTLNLICPYCGQVHDGDCHLLGNLVINEKEPEYPDLTKPPILDGPPSQDDIPKSIVDQILESIKSNQDAIKSLNDRLNKGILGYIKLPFGDLSKYARPIIFYGAVILGSLLLVYVVYTRIIKSDGLTEYSKLVQKQMTDTKIREF